jgi:hypothetical protein
MSTRPRGGENVLAVGTWSPPTPRHGRSAGLMRSVTVTTTQGGRWGPREAASLLAWPPDVTIGSQFARGLAADKPQLKRSLLRISTPFFRDFTIDSFFRDKQLSFKSSFLSRRSSSAAQRSLLRISRQFFSGFHDRPLRMRNSRLGLGPFTGKTRPKPSDTNHS